MRINIFLTIVLLLNLNKTTFGQDESKNSSCTTIACHGSIIAEAVVHYAVESGCDNCHQKTGIEHPTSGEKGFKLISEVPVLCFTCHDPNNTKTNVHSPSAKGECLSCHNPHSSPENYLLKENPAAMLCSKCHVINVSNKKVQHAPVTEGKCGKCHNPHESDEPKFLKRKTKDLCVKCHEATKEQFDLKTIHAPFAENCVSCHDQIHGSDEVRLSSKSGKDLCFKCHDKKIQTKTTVLPNLKSLFETSEFVHGAITKDGCISCHNPHASENPSLLTAKFPEGNYAQGTKENYELCFKCHDAALLESASVATGFKNGNQNLHYLHVNKEKGRSCVNCHNPHAANNKKLITKSVTFGNWDMPLNFILLDNGGSCRPGCHAEKKYVR